MNKRLFAIVLFGFATLLCACTSPKNPEAISTLIQPPPATIRAPANTEQSTNVLRTAFVSNRDGNPEIYAMNADGSAPTNLTNNPAQDSNPNWSPDGKRIAFFTDRDGNVEIYVMNADGSGQTDLSNNPAYDSFPFWSPDGKHIEFSSERDGNREVYIMNGDGLGQINLSNNPADDIFSDWSPNGERIAFSSKRDGNWEIYVINTDSLELTNLTNNPATDSAASWSPDGKRIAYSSDRDGNSEIYVMNADGIGQTRLTQSPAEDGAPIWSPDGKLIAYYSKNNEKRDIYVMNADGSAQTNLTNNSADDYFFRWSPDSATIVFMSNRDVSGYNLYMINTDGSDLIRVTYDTAGDSAPMLAQSPPIATHTVSIIEQVTAVPWLHHIIGGLQGNVYDSPNLHPTGLAIAPDGSLFVATAAHSFIFHIDPYGKLIKAWGGFQQVDQGQKAAPGVFNQPWGIAITPDGYLYATDLWNHRIQKFTQDGRFVLEWGEAGQGNEPYKFFGPRGIAIDTKGRVFVADTGNKRVVVYDSNGIFISQIGGEGKELGQFDEPIGIAVDLHENIYVADYWNGRVQVIQIDDSGVMTPKAAWNIEGWKDKSEDYKPFLCLHNDHIFATVPAHNRVLEFSTQGDLLNTLDINQTGILKDGMPTGCGSDPNGGIWVSDFKNNLWYYLIP